MQLSFDSLWSGGKPAWQALLLVLLAAVTLIGVLNIFSGTTIEEAESLKDLALSFPSKDLKYVEYTLGAIVLLLLIFNKVFQREALLLLVVPAVAVIAGKGAAVVSLTVFSLSCIGVGGFVYRWFDPDAPGMLKVIPSFMLGVCINSYIVYVAMHFPVNFTYTYYCYFFLTIVVFHKTIRSLLGRIREDVSMTGNPFSVKVIFCASLFYLIYALVPTPGCDGCMHHMYIPKYVEVYGQYHFDPQVQIWSFNTAMISQGSYTALFLLGDEFSVRIFMLLLVICALFMAESYARRTYNKKVSFFVVLAMSTTPYLTWVIATVFIDTLSLLLSTIVYIHLLRCLQHLTAKKVYLYFLLMGFGFLCKQMGLIYFIPTVIVFLGAVIKHVHKTREYGKIAHFMAGFMVIVVLMAPLLTYNYYRTYNPIFPFCNTYFKSPFYPESDFDGNRESLWNNPLNVKTVYDITFHGSKYTQNTDNNFGTYYFQFLLFFPLLLVGARAARHRMTAMLLLFILAVYTWVMFKTSGLYVRYFIGSLFVGSLLVSLIMDRFWDLIKSSSTARVITCVLFIATFSMNFVVQNAQIVHIPKYPAKEALTGDHPGDWITCIYDYANLKYGKNSKGLIVDDFHYNLAGFHVVGTMWFHFHHRELLAKAKTPDELADCVFKTLGADFIIISKEWPLSAWNEPLRTPEFLSKLKTEFSSAYFAVYSLKDDA